MIDVIGTAITDEIVRRLKEAELFAVIADETPDTSHNEQFSITVRYVYQGDVEEKYTEELVRNALGLPSKCDQHIQCDRRGNCRNVENHPRN